LYEIALLIQKLFLTGLIIFIKPDTVSQLAAGFVISISFFVLHVLLHPYKRSEEDMLQFCASLAISMSLFIGILLKTNTDEEDPYSKLVMYGLLGVLNVGVFVMLITQIWYGIKQTVSNFTESMRAQLAETAAKQAVEYVRPKLAKELGETFQSQEFDRNLIKVFVQMLDAAEQALPDFIEKSEDPMEFMKSLKELSSAEDEALMDLLSKMCTEILGKAKMVEIIKPFCITAGDRVHQHMLDWPAPTNVVDLVRCLTLMAPLAVTCQGAGAMLKALKSAVAKSYTVIRPYPPVCSDITSAHFYCCL